MRAGLRAAAFNAVRAAALVGAQHVSWRGADSSRRYSDDSFEGSRRPAEHDGLQKEQRREQGTA